MAAAKQDHLEILAAGDQKVTIDVTKTYFIVRHGVTSFLLPRATTSIEAAPGKFVMRSGQVEVTRQSNPNGIDHQMTFDCVVRMCESVDKA